MTVMLSHLVLAITVRSAAWLERAPHDLAQGIAAWMIPLGAWGVGLFFVLSGLCIHLPMARKLAEDPRASLPIGPYYARRFTRIYPPHLVVLLLSALLGLTLPPRYLPGTLLTRPTWTQLVAHLVMLHPFVPGAIFSISGVLWTIALETHFYLLYPLLLKARRRYRMEVICAALFVLSILVRIFTKRFVTSEFSVILDQSSLRRYWEWALGCVIAERIVARPHAEPEANASPALTAALFVGSYVAGVLVTSLPLGGAIQTTLWPLLFAVAIERMARQPFLSGGLLERVVLWAGHTSYSLYLTHPIGLAITIFLARAAGAPLAVEAAAGLLGTFLVWSAFFYGIERPFVRRAAKIQL